MKVSIITVCQNEVNRIGETVESVCQQTYADREHIIIDGDSDDGTMDVLRSYRNHLASLVSEPDDGIFSAMNKGASIARGEYLYFLNAGDKFAHDNVLADVLVHDPDSDLVYGNLIFRHADRDELRTQPRRIDTGYLLARTIYHPAVLIRSSLFEELGGYDTRYRIAGDYEFFLRSLLQYDSTTSYVPVTFAIFDTGGISSGMESSQLHLRERLAIQRDLLPRRYYLIALCRVFLMRNRDNAVARWFLRHGHTFYRYFKPSSGTGT